MAIVDAACDVVIKESGNIVKNLIEGFDWLAHHDVWVGISDATTGRAGGMTNASLLYLHSVGSPVNHIPARPVLEPALNDEDVYKELNDILLDGIESALQGEVENAEQKYMEAGMAGAAAVQDYFTGGGLAPNAPYTIAKKGSSQPLIDTGALRAAITYVIKEK